MEKIRNACALVMQAIKGLIVGGGLLIGVSMDDARSESQKVEPVRPIEEGSAKKDDIERHRREIATFRAKLASAKTAEERQAMVAELRSEMAKTSPTKVTAEGESRHGKLAELKVKAAGNPEMMERVAKLEERLNAVDSLGASLEAAGKAEGAEKGRLIAQVNQKRQALVAAQQAHSPRQETGGISGKGSATQSRDLSPEMMALKAKSEERKREVEQLKEALEQASPQEKVNLLSEWRKKQMQKMSQRKIDQELGEPKQP